MNESKPDPNPDARLDALFALARSQRLDTATAEYAFETRLMARLHDAPDIDSIWAKVSWRMLPFFAICVVALAVWHSEIASQAQEAEQTAYVENPETLDLWDNLN